MQRNRHYYAGTVRLIAISKIVEAHLLQHGIPAGKISLIYDGIDVEKFAAPATATVLRNEWATPAGGQVVGFVGRLVSWKGVEDLIRAASIVLTASPNVVFVVVGDDEEGGRYAQQLQALTKTCGVEQAFRFVGFQRDVPAVLSSLDVLVLPSHREPLGNIVLEAMAARLLVVATNDGGAAELIRDRETGFLTLSQQPAVLAQTILQALHIDAAQRECMVTAAQRDVQLWFTVQRQVSQLGSLYRSLR
jgi:glycosyltransferase involved in cell wall biosynthesis